jgi:hypothetical protein
MASHGGGSRTGATGIMAVQFQSCSSCSSCQSCRKNVRTHGVALHGSRTGATGSWLCTARFANRGYGIVALHCAVHEPERRNHGGAMPNPVNPVNPVEKRPNAWRHNARFTNRNDGIVAVQCPIRSILSLLSKNVRTHGVALRGSRTGLREPWRRTGRFVNRNDGNHGFPTLSMSCRAPALFPCRSVPDPSASPAASFRMTWCS